MNNNSDSNSTNRNNRGLNHPEQGTIQETPCNQSAPKEHKLFKIIERAMGTHFFKRDDDGPSYTFGGAFVTCDAMVFDICTVPCHVIGAPKK